MRDAIAEIGRRDLGLSPQKRRESTANEHAAGRNAQRPPNAFEHTDLLWHVSGSEFLS